MRRTRMIYSDIGIGTINSVTSVMRRFYCPRKEFRIVFENGGGILGLPLCGCAGEATMTVHKAANRIEVVNLIFLQMGILSFKERSVNNWGKIRAHFGSDDVRSPEKGMNLGINRYRQLNKL